MTDDWLEKAIREATDRGDFDDLPGSGRPIDGLGRTYDPAWWAKGFVTRERAREAGIELVADIDRLLPRMLATRQLEEVMEQVTAWNAEIELVNNRIDVPDRLHSLDAGEIADRWRALRR